MRLRRQDLVEYAIVFERKNWRLGVAKAVD